MKTQPLGPFLGINNRLPDFGLHVPKRGDFLRSAVNVDVTNAGNLTRRKACSLVQAMTAPHSLFKGYLVRASILYQVTLPGYTEALIKVLSSNAPMSYAEYNGDIYFSNGTDSGRIAANGIVYPWALPTPDAPTAATIAGTLFAGWYQVAFSYTNSATGEEGGVGPSDNYHLLDVGGLRVTLPPAVNGATHINVYASTVSGAVPMLHSTYPVGTTYADLTTPAAGREAIQRYEKPLPAGTRLFVFNGSLCSISGKVWNIGLPWRPGYCLAVGSGVPFPETVSIAVASQTGVYIAADKTYFFAGTNPAEIEGVRDVLPYGAVPGTEFVVPNKTRVGWFGAKGFVLADTQGEVEAVMSDNIDLTPPASGTSIIFETHGNRRVVSCGWCLNLDNLSATNYTDFDFTSASGGYGTKADGIYLLEGSGLVANWLVGFGKHNFGSEKEKHLPAVYLGATSDEPITLRIGTASGEEYDYDARSCGASMNMHRIDVGRGLRSNWFDLTLLQSNGSDFTLASVSFMPLASSRSI